MHHLMGQFMHQNMRVKSLIHPVLATSRSNTHALKRNHQPPLVGKIGTRTARQPTRLMIPLHGPKQ